MRSRRRIFGGRTALTRRDFLAASLGAAVIGCGSSSSQEEQPSVVPPIEKPPYDPSLPPLTWMRDARIAGFETYVGYPKGAVAYELDKFVAAQVNVVVVDSGLSFYSNDTQFEAEVAHIDYVTRECHARGMKAVAYYPMLEVLTEDADSTPNTMFKDHPDWVQIGIDGQPNTFIGGEGRVFWVPEGCESAWLCPTSGYADYYLARVKRLAATALDGLWGDVPLLSDIVGIWPCTNASCAAKFQRDTGLMQPASEDWDDPTFRRWVAWRHQLIHEFEQAVLAAGRSVRPDFQLIVETVTMDYTAGTAQGLDGAAADPGDVHRVWEIDAVSDSSSMREASADDWISMAIMMRHAHGCSGSKPGWAISYGKQADDAEKVLALTVVGGVCPYETKIPRLNETVGVDYRARVFGWLRENNDIWAGTSGASVGVIYSSLSRDFVDRTAGVGLYTSVNPNDPLWWSTLPADSAKALPYVGEYRGMCKALIHAHAPYDVVPSVRISAETLARYALVVAPRPAALSDAEIAALVAYVERGGTLLITGPDAGSYDERGAERGQPALLSAFGIPLGTPAFTRKPHGSGHVVFVEELLGVRYFSLQEASLLAEVGRVLDAAKRTIVTDAPPPVVFDVRRASDVRLNVLCANIVGLDTGSFAPKVVTFRVGVDTGGKTPLRVTSSEPGVAGAREVPFVYEAGRVMFDMTVSSLLLARVDLE